MNWFICRTCILLGTEELSVINGNGTYGGIRYTKDGQKNEGLLEIWGSWIQEPIGYLTADEVIKILEDHKQNYSIAERIMHSVTSE